MSDLFFAAWRYRSYIVSAIKNDFRVRVARSRMGIAWVILHPLAQVAVFAIVLSNVLQSRMQGMENKYSFVVYLMAGLLCWNLFAEIVQRCLTIFIDQASMLKKLQFPRVTLPIVVAGSALVSNLALAVAILVLIPLIGYPLQSTWFWIPFLILVTSALALGLGLLLGTLNVFARDIGQVMAIIMQFWFWLTPVVYLKEILPESMKLWLWINPMAALVEAYHNVIVYGRAPDASLWIPIGWAVTFLIGALLVFRRASPELVDAL